jgi:DNA-binding CsgD family transcriptional regulator
MMNDANSEELHGVIGDIYQAAYDTASWPTAVDKLRSLFNGSQACLCRIGPDIQPSDAVASNADPDAYKIYARDFSHEISMFEKAVAAAPVGLVYNDHTLLGRDQLRKSRFWNDWMAPQDMFGGLGCKLLTSGPSSWFVDIQRGANQEEFGSTDMRVLGVIAPHVKRAVDIGRLFQTTRVLSSAFSLLPFGIVLADSSLRIIAQNEMAETFMARPDCVFGRKFGYLTVNDDRNYFTLKKLVRDACSLSSNSLRGGGLGGDFLITERPVGKRPIKFSVSVGPLARPTFDDMFVEPCAVIVLRKMSSDIQPAFIEQVEALFDLPRKKAELAVLLASGRSLKDAAQEQGIKFGSARKYLEEIFEKTATHQQTQFVALLKSIEPMLPSKDVT